MDLFDVADDEAPSDWQEVPQARFLSWPPEMQFTYCAARDQHSACEAESLQEYEWFTARAKIYKEMSHGNRTIKES